MISSVHNKQCTALLRPLASSPTTNNVPRCSVSTACIVTYNKQCIALLSVYRLHRHLQQTMYRVAQCLPLASSPTSRSKYSFNKHSLLRSYLSTSTNCTVGGGYNLVMFIIWIETSHIILLHTIGKEADHWNRKCSAEPDINSSLELYIYMIYRHTI